MSTPYRCSIAADIFGKFPGYVRGVVVAEGVTNRESPPELVAALREAEARLPAAVSLEQIADHPRIKAWREAYRSFGAKPSEFRSSVEAMARRALRGDPLPSISALVDIGNILSLRHLFPAGGHAIDVLRGDMVLRLATGCEQFLAFGSQEVEQPLPGEVIFAEGNVVLTRRWTWRQAQHTLIVPGTTAVELNLDGMPPVEVGEIETACAEAMELIGRYCGGRMRFEMLSEAHPEMELRV